MKQIPWYVHKDSGSKIVSFPLPGHAIYNKIICLKGSGLAVIPDDPSVVWTTGFGGASPEQATTMLLFSVDRNGSSAHGTSSAEPESCRRAS